jgi:serine/threonine protein phosphatase PrpC
MPGEGEVMHAMAGEVTLHCAAASDTGLARQRNEDSAYAGRYLDGRPEQSPDMALRQGLPGDRYLLCSDGLSSAVSHLAILQALQSATSVNKAVQSLIALAYEGGAPGNVTVLVLDVAQAKVGAHVLSKPVMLGAAGAPTPGGAKRWLAH